jgi:hypothetical protein
LLFPDPPRTFPGRRLVKIGLRAVHVLCAALCLGAYAFETDARLPWLLAAIATGAAILLLDLHESAAFLLQVRGAILVAKLAALALLPSLGEARPWALGGILLVSVVSSHAPSKVRYHVLFGRGRIEGARTPG